MKNLNYKELKIQKYFLSKDMTSKTKIVLFKARNRMLNVASNYGSKTECPLCKLNKDDQQHLMECLIIKLTCPVILNNNKIKYEDLYSEDTTNKEK